MVALCSVVKVKIYDRDASTLRATFNAGDGNGVTGLQWSDPLGQVGSGAFTVPLQQPLMLADPDLFGDGAVAKVATNLTTDPDGDGLWEVFGFLAGGGEWTLIGAGELAGEARSLEGPGLLALFDDWTVHSEGGYRDIQGDRRHFGWMSGFMLDDPGWDGTIHKTKWSAVPSTSDRYHKPKGWPDHNAYWINTGDKTKQYAARPVTLDDEAAVRIYASADEDLRVYWDSELVIKNNSREVGYTELNHHRERVAAGDHTLAVEWRHIPGGVHSWSGVGWDLGDVDKAIVTVLTVDRDGTTKDVLARTNDGVKWVACQRGSDDRPPAPTAAKILLTLAGEANDRASDAGVASSMSLIAFDFDETADSDGNDWTDRHEKAWPVGTKGGQVVADIGDDDIDFDMLPDLTLKAYTSQGSDKSGTVALVKGGNIFSAKASVRPVLATSLQVRAAHRWVNVHDQDAESATGYRVEGFLSGGNKAVSRVQAKHHGKKALEHMSTERLIYTYEFRAVDGCVPYLDFGKGDVISAPDRYGDNVKMRVLSLSGALPSGEGEIVWTAECRPRAPFPISEVGPDGGGDIEFGSFPFGTGDVIVAVLSYGNTTGASADMLLLNGGSWVAQTQKSSVTGHNSTGYVWTAGVGSDTTAVLFTLTGDDIHGAKVDLYRIPASVGVSALQQTSDGAGLGYAEGGGTVDWSATGGSGATYFVGVIWDAGSDPTDAVVPMPYDIQIGRKATMTSDVGDDHYAAGFMIGLN